jgi:hypothetical protein
VEIDDVLPGDGPIGDRFEAFAVEEYRPSVPERVLLRRLAVAMNRCEQLEAEVAARGLIDAETGRATGAAVELRLTEQVVAKLYAGMRFPVDDANEDEEGAPAPPPPYDPQAPRGPRGPYGGGRRRDLRAVEDAS